MNDAGIEEMRVAVSWSGGKDGCLACFKAMEHGYRVERLLTFVSKQYKRCCFHGIETKLSKLQAESTGIPLIHKAVGRAMKSYERDFKQAVSALRQKGIKGMVFGDIYLDEHKSWVERVCGELDIMPIEPLWGMEPGEVAREFVDAGFKAIVVSCKADLFDRDFVGRLYDWKLIRELEKRRICPCGENGEFHTLVVDGPLFRRRVEILESRPILKEGFWKHWFLDIRKFGAGEIS